MENVFELVGYQKFDFKDKQGKDVKGMNIYYVMQPSAQKRANGFVGKISGKQYFPVGANVPSQLQGGQSYEFIFGYVDGQPKVTGFRSVNK